MEIDDKLFRSIYIWKEIDKIREYKNINYTTLAELMWLKSYQPLSNPLQWKIIWSDKLFKRIAKAIWISEKKIEEIFKNADLELTKKKYPEEFQEKTQKQLDSDNFKVAFKKEYWKELTENDKEILDRLFKKNWI